MLKAQEVIEQLEKYSGNLTAAAKALGVDRTTIYRHMEKHPTVRQALDTARETMIDNVESRLYKSALDGEAWAVCFFLKTQAKHRGYTERQEVTGADGNEITIKVVYGDSDNTAKTA